MADKIFIDGMNVDTVETQYGEIVKLGFNVNKFILFAQEHISDTGWLNVDILTNKDGKKYAALNNYKKQ